MGARPSSFKKKLLASSISSCLLASAGVVSAQEQQAQGQGPTVIEEVQVLGIRSSLEQAMDIKRDATGVVDAISSEDIGKMPDQNLAESLQRISGLSISRTNGEGSEVTARGIDARYNMVTLNGRNMPAVSNNGRIGDQATRAFDFSNLASETVSGIEVYKTGRASIPSGGLGATINVKTLRPLDAGDVRAAVGVKAVHDTTVTRGEGQEVTPEVSGLFTWLNDEENFGVSITGAYQERANSRSNAFVNQWQPFTWNDNGDNAIPYPAYAVLNDMGQVLRPDGTPYEPTRNADGAIINPATGALYTPVAGVDFEIDPAANVPQDGQLYNLPTDIRYALEDNTRVRTNAQITMQFRPVESLTATLDYTYSENKLEAERSQQSTWFGVGNITDIVFDSNTEARSPLIYEETYPDSFKDIAFAQQMFNSETQNDSIGVNLVFEPNDNMMFMLDYHDSSAENVLSQQEAGLATQVARIERALFDRDLPVMGVIIDDAATLDSRRNPLSQRQRFDLWYAQNEYLAAGGSTDDDAYAAIAQQPEFLGDQYTSGNANGVIDAGDAATTIGTFDRGLQRTDIKQLQLDAEINFDDFAFFNESAVGFGAEMRKDSNNTRVGQNRITMGNWGGVDPARFDDSYFSARDFGAGFPDYEDTTEHPWFLSEGIDANASDLFEIAEWMNANPDVRDPNNFNGFVNGQAQWNGQYQTNRTIIEEVMGAYVQFSGRFEVAGMDAGMAAGVKYEETEVTAMSDVVPPTNLIWQSDDDWDLPTAGASVTTERTANYDNVLPSIDLDISPIEDVKVRLSYSQTIARAEYGRLRPNASIDTPYVRRIAREGEPGLLPMQSDNLDLSVEWYYTEDSYVSAGYFRKNVSNFIGDIVVDRPHYGLTDPLLSELYQTVVLDAGIAPNSTAAFLAFAEARGIMNPTEATVDIPALPTDPEAVFATTVPSNNQDAVIDGMEFSLQHWFGDSGFGVQANATVVESDVGFDNARQGQQFAMIGLSNSANLIGFFENDDWQVRVAYNWRDEFLNNTTFGGGNEPSYTEAFTSLDFTIGYIFSDNLSFSLEGINVTGENSRTHGRSEVQMQSLEDLGARYAIGARLSF